MSQMPQAIVQLLPLVLHEDTMVSEDGMVWHVVLEHNLPQTIHFQISGKGECGDGSQSQLTNVGDAFTSIARDVIDARGGILLGCMPCL